MSTLGDDISWVFAQVLIICDGQGLIGREMFAIDGVKLPSNASKAKSGTREDFLHQAQKLEKCVKDMLQRHQRADELGIEPDLLAREETKRQRLHDEAVKLQQWLADHPDDRKGAKGTVRKSNRTDNDSAKMATSKGVIQGHTAVAAVDSQCQIIVQAQAHGTGSEHELLMPTVQAMEDMLAADSLITADAGYHSEGNLQALADRGIEALIADNKMRMRDERFADQDRYKKAPDPLVNKADPDDGRRLFRPRHFLYDPVKQTCICPAGKQLYRNGNNCITRGFKAVKFHGTKRDCLPCELRERCLRHPDRTPTRQVSFFAGKANKAADNVLDRMRERIDSPEGRARYGQRLGTVEPVFANLRHNKGLDRFTLRGKAKVNAQWKLYCLVHNIEKLAHHGYAR